MASTINTWIAANYSNLSGFFTRFVTRLVVAAIIILIGFILGRIAGKIVLRILNEIELNKILKKATNVKISLEEMISHGISYFIYFVAIIWALETLNLAPIILYIISIGFIVVVILSVLLGVKDFIPNFFAGFFIHRRKIVKKGDYLKLGDVEGTVDKVTLLDTLIKTKQGDTLYVPNSALLKSQFIILKKKK